MALHGRQHHSGKRRMTNERRSLTFECLERRSLLSASPFHPAPRPDFGPPAFVGNPHPGASGYPDAGQGAVDTRIVAGFSETVGPDSLTLSISLTVGDAKSLEAFTITETINIGHTQAGGGIKSGNSTSGPPATDVYKAPQPDSDGSYGVYPPAPHVSSLPAEAATRMADSVVAQPSKDDILAIEDAASAATPASYETSPASESVSAENNLGAAANSVQYLGNLGDSVADASAARSAEGGFVVLDEASLGNIDSGPVAIGVAPGAHKSAGQAGADLKSAGKSLMTVAHGPDMRNAISQTSLDATVGGAIDLTDAAQASAASETADANDGKMGQANTDFASESGVAQFCDMEVAVGAPTSDELPLPVVFPIGNASQPAAAQGQRAGQNIKPAQESAHRIDPRQRVSMGLTDATPFIAGAAMLVLSKGVELEPAEREPKRRFPGLKR